MKAVQLLHRWTPFVVVVTLALAADARGGLLLHDYQFNGDLADSLGGPALVDLGGTITSSKYVFAAGQGLSLSSGLTDFADYSVVLDFSFEVVTGFRRIVEFKDLTADRGLYVVGGALAFYDVAIGPGDAFSPNTESRVILTRDGTTGLFKGYWNGAEQFSFSDSSGFAEFSGPNSIIHFFQDDGSEMSAGVVDRIRIYDGALTPAEIESLDSPTGVPEPPTATGLLVGLVALAGYRMNRRSTRAVRKRGRNQPG